MFINKILRIVIVCLCITGFGNSSAVVANVDSILAICKENQLSSKEQFHTINTYYIAYSATAPEEIIQLIDYHYALAKKNDEKREVIKALNEKGFVFHMQGKALSTMKALEQALELAIMLGDSNILARQYINIGNAYRLQNKYQITVRYYELGLEIFQEKKLLTLAAHALNNIGLVYYDIKDYDRALNYLNKALELYKTFGVEDKVGAIWLNIGFISYYQKKYAEALPCAKKSIKILEETQELLSLLDAYVLYARVQQQLEQIDTALYYAEKGLKIAQKIDHQNKPIEIETFIAELLLAKDLFNATQKAEMILAGLDQATNKDLKVSLFNVLYQCYKAQKKYDLSLSMHEQYLLYKDSLQIENDRMAIIRHAIQNEYEDKLHQNQITHEKAQAALELKQLKITFTVVFVFILLILGIITYARSSIRSSRKEKEGLLKEVERLKNISESPVVLQSNKFELHREKIEQFISRKINETD
jgi:tetratricopeptide (TPR) repeat protein